MNTATTILSAGVGLLAVSWILNTLWSRQIEHRLAVLEKAERDREASLHGNRFRPAEINRRVSRGNWMEG